MRVSDDTLRLLASMGDVESQRALGIRLEYFSVGLRPVDIVARKGQLCFLAPQASEWLWKQPTANPTANPTAKEPSSGG